MEDIDEMHRFQGYLIVFDGGSAKVVLYDEQGHEADAEMSAKWFLACGIPEQTWFSFEIQKREEIVEWKITPVQPQEITPEYATQLWEKHREVLTDFNYRDDE